MVKKKNLPALWEIWVPSLGWKDLLEKGTATHFSILAWRIPWTEEPGGPQSWDCKELDTTEQLSTYPYWPLPFKSWWLQTLKAPPTKADNGV